MFLILHLVQVVVKPALMDDILQWAQAKAAFSEARQTDKRVPGAAKQELQFGLTQAELTEKLGAFLSRR